MKEKQSTYERNYEDTDIAYVYRCKSCGGTFKGKIDLGLFVNIPKRCPLCGALTAKFN